jgi:hypothetical protein
MVESLPALSSHELTYTRSQIGLTKVHHHSMQIRVWFARSVIITLLAGSMRHEESQSPRRDEQSSAGNFVRRRYVDI